MEKFDDCELVTAMITPMQVDGSVDYDAVELLARHIQKNASDGILIGGSTGEEPNLTSDEKWRVFERVKKTIQRPNGQRDIKLLIGTGTSSTRTTVEETKKAYQAGADGAVIIVPPQVKPNEDGQIFHFGYVASAVPDLPIIIYNIPSRTGVNMSPSTVARLAHKYPNIIGIKQSFNDLSMIEEMKKLCPPDFKIYSGDDDLTLDMVNRGAQGVISVASHIDGRNIKKMIIAAKSGKKDEANRLNQMLSPLFKACFVTTNPMPIKHLLAERVVPWMTSTLRPPMVPLNPQLHDQMNGLYTEYLNNKSKYELSLLGKPQKDY